jgi:hypothetical protein
MSKLVYQRKLHQPTLVSKTSKMSKKSKTSKMSKTKKMIKMSKMSKTRKMSKTSPQVYQLTWSDLRKLHQPTLVPRFLRTQAELGSLLCLKRN